MDFVNYSLIVVEMARANVECDFDLLPALEKKLRDLRPFIAGKHLLELDLMRNTLDRVVYDILDERDREQDEEDEENKSGRENSKTKNTCIIPVGTRVQTNTGILYA